MIHEGAHGIHGLDLLGRKVRMNDGAGLRLFAERVTDTIVKARAQADTADAAAALESALASLIGATRAAWTTPDPEAALANATAYLEAFGHLTVAWLWLDLTLAAPADAAGLDEASRDHRRGLAQAMRYFYDYELPRLPAWLAVVSARTATCREMQEDWF
jgi:butyryl-CoA dehydrogenase